jgi:hypothetical protein
MDDGKVQISIRLVSRSVYSYDLVQTGNAVTLNMKGKLFGSDSKILLPYFAKNFTAGSHPSSGWRPGTPLSGMREAF